MSGVALELSIGLSPLLLIIMDGHAGLPDVWCGAGAVKWLSPLLNNGWAPRPSVGLSPLLVILMGGHTLPSSSNINGWARRPS